MITVCDIMNGVCLCALCVIACTSPQFTLFSVESFRPRKVAWAEIKLAVSWNFQIFYVLRQWISSWGSWSLEGLRTIS